MYSLMYCLLVFGCTKFIFCYFRLSTKSLFESSPSVKFTPSQPPSPLMPYGGDSYQPYLFRRWSAHTHTFANPTIGSGSGHNSGSNSGSSGGNYSSIGGYGSGSSYGGGSSSGGGGGVGAGFALSSAFPFSRRWSVPANQPPGSTTGRHMYWKIYWSE